MTEFYDDAADLYNYAEAGVTEFDQSERYENALQYIESQQAQAEYASRVEDITSRVNEARQSDPSLPEVDPELFVKHMAATDFDQDAAYQSYAEEEALRTQKAIQSIGSAPPPPETAQSRALDAIAANIGTGRF